MKFTLKAEMDHESGEIGWKDSRIPRDSGIYGPLFGFGIAHDLLEHFAFEHIGDEIEAHAAMYRIRYETGYRNKYGRGIELGDFSSEWIELVRGLERDGRLPTFFAKRTRPLSEEIERDIDAIIEEGKRMVMEENSYDGMEESTREMYASMASEIARVFRNYFRNGYRKTGKRYRGVDMSQVSYTFERLAKAFEKLTPEFEGDAITVDVRGGEVCIRTMYDGESYA